MSSINFILIACFGAAVQEIIHWYDLRNTIEDAKAVLKSPFYWSITVLMILASGVGSWILFYDQIPDKRSIQFILGAAFPLIFKKAVGAVKEKGQELGGTATPSMKSVLDDYFK